MLYLSIVMRGEFSRRSVKKTGTDIFSDTLCLVNNFSLHGVTVKRSTIALRIILFKATTHPRRPRPMIVTTGAANSHKSVPATRCATLRFAPGNGLYMVSTGDHQTFHVNVSDEINEPLQLLVCSYPQLCTTFRFAFRVSQGTVCSGYSLGRIQVRQSCTVGGCIR